MRSVRHFSTADRSAGTWIRPAQVIADGLDVLIPDAWLDPLRPDATTVPASETQQSLPLGPATRRGSAPGQV